jgi:hypothetical protein
MRRYATTGRLIAVARCAAPATLFAASLLIISSHAEERGRTSLIAPGAAVADGRPWNMVAIVSKDAFTLTLMPNGTGTMEPGLRASELTWWQNGERFCLKSSMTRERCVILLARDGGYDAVENGALLFTMRR